jgi:hypothetical protein
MVGGNGVERWTFEKSKAGNGYDRDDAGSEDIFVLYLP